MAGLTPAEVTGFHIHAGPPGVNGPIVLDLGTASLVPAGGGFTYNASGLVFPPLHQASLLGGNAYVNLHNGAFPGGAIRAQLVPQGNVDLSSGAATGAGLVAGIENVIGGDGNDSIVGSFGANVLAGGAGNDVIFGGPWPDTLNGNGGSDVILWTDGDDGDSVDGNEASDTFLVNGSTSSADAFYISSLNGRLRLELANPGTVFLDASVDTLAVIGHGGSDTFQVHDLGGSPELTQLQVHGALGDDTFIFIPTSPTQVFQVHGGAGSDTLRGPSGEITWNLTGPGSGNITGAVSSFSFVENLTGGSFADTFLFTPTGSVTGTIDGGLSTDTLDYGSLSADLTVNLGMTTTSLTAAMDGEQAVPYWLTSARGTATVSNYNPTTHTFDLDVSVTGMTAGEVTGFRLRDAIPGSTGPVIVDLLAAAPLTPTGNGFTYSATGLVLPAERQAAFLGGCTYLNVETFPVPSGVIRGQLAPGTHVDLAAGTATATGGVVNVENVFGGTGADSLVGNSAVNNVQGNGGNDTIIGGPGNDILIGASQDDRLVWNDWDSSDVLDGGVGSDTIVVNGSSIGGDAFSMIAFGTRLLLNRVNLTPFTLDIRTTETVVVNGYGGSDAFTVDTTTGIANLGMLLLRGNSDADAFRITPSQMVMIEVRGGEPMPPGPGDILTVPTAGTSRPTVLANYNPDGFSGAFSSASHQPVGLVSIDIISPLTVRGDFTGDHKSDLFWRNSSTGDNSAWVLDGMGVAATAGLPTVADPNFQVVGLGDFQADGKADLLWRNAVAGTNVVWLMDGLAVAVTAMLPDVPDPSWIVAGLGDFQGDGKSDIFWRNTVTGSNAVWIMNGTSPALTATLPAVADPNWAVAGIGDVQGDGRDDVLWRNAATGSNVLWLMNGVNVTSVVLTRVPDPSWRVAGMGDFQGDGKKDILWRNESTGDNALWMMNGAAIAVATPVTSVPDTGWKIVRIGDFQADGKADIFWRNSASGSNSVWLMSGPNVAATAPLTAVPDTSWKVAGGP